MDNNILLSVQDLKVHFIGDETVARALNGVSYEVKEGEAVCIVGESGCGKTVSVLTVLGLIPQPPGKVIGGTALFRGQNILDLDDTAILSTSAPHVKEFAAVVKRAGLEFGMSLHWGKNSSPACLH